jgi:hypothetical protein
MGATTISPLLPFDLGIALPGLQCVLLMLVMDFLPQFYDQMDRRHNNCLERSLICLL